MRVRVKLRVRVRVRLRVRVRVKLRVRVRVPGVAVATGIAVTATTGEAARTVPESGKETGWQDATRCCGYSAGACPGGVGAQGLPIAGGGI